MNAKKPVRILICTGHTGGHFFPALSFSETLRVIHPEAEIHLPLSRTTQFSEALLRDDSFSYQVIPLNPIPSFFSFKMLKFLLNCVNAFWKTFLLFLKIRPSLVVGFGSFGSAPGVFSAVLFRVPILLHEQNVVMGRANRLFAPFASKIAISFPTVDETGFRKKTIWSGYPLRKAFKSVMRVKEHSKNSQKLFTVLVFGGSQGASRLNEFFISSLGLLNAEERQNFAVIHIVGNSNVQAFKLKYQVLGIQAQVYEFSHQIAEHYKDANLVISRAGAGTIFELAASGRAAILIPYPHAYAHQKFNAEYLVRNHAASVIEETRLTPQLLLEEILELKKDQRKRLQFEQNIKSLFKPDADHILAETSWSLTCKQN